MAERLNDVGKHKEWGTGHYEAIVLDDGTVILSIIFDDAKQPHKVTLTRDEWFRLAGWVAWAQEDWHPKE